MPKIQVLSKQIAELIAAGEVVERPSSVIKELVENSVDAGATVVTVEIRNGGITFMRVTDNGCGMAAEDVPTAFLRHATSKIQRAGDLDSIGTLGFRGEALASVSAVSHVELLTRMENASTGVRYVGEGEAYTLEEAGCPVGTTFIVRDLFYNTPARMKFLKKDATEGNAVAGIMDKMALARPDISFRFIRDGKEALHTPGKQGLRAAIYGVYGKEFAHALIPVEYSLGGVRVTGFISTPAGNRANRSMQNFFINGRFIRSRTAGAALEEAYKGSMMVGRFPACVLHLELSFEAVDVNVHPAKLEVRFVNERPIFDAVYHGVKSALQAGDRPKIMPLKRPDVGVLFAPEEKAEQTRLSFKEKETAPLKVEPEHLKARPCVPENSVGKETLLKDSAIMAEEVVWPQTPFEKILDYMPKAQLDTKAIDENSSSLPSDSPESVELIPPEASLSRSSVKEEAPLYAGFIGEAFGTYILVQYGAESLMLIDKHAAHERLLYEKLKAQRGKVEAQALLEPVIVTLDKDEYSAVLGRQEELFEAGFEVDDFGVGTILVRSVPMVLEGQDAAASIMEIAGYLAEFKSDFTPEHLDWIYHNVACRAAIKAGDFTSSQELISLAQELECNPEVRYCPHGRPVYVLIRKKDIEKQFGR